MKKITLLSYFLLFLSILSLPRDLFSQNVGIGTTTPTCARLELNGAVGQTRAIFGGDGNGISLQRNLPAIGFNHYYNGGSKYIANGRAAVFYFDPTGGGLYLDMFPNGSANSIGTPSNVLTIDASGNSGVRTAPLNSTFYSVKAGNYDGSAVFGGTTWNSHFHYSSTEDTYIRGGKNGSMVIINDIPNGNIQMGSGSTKVGINTGPYAPASALEISGALSYRAGVYAVTTVNNTIAVGDRSFIYLTNPNLTPGLQFFLTNGIASGQMLIIEAAIGNANISLTLSETGNIKSKGSNQIQNEDTMMLI